jgi:hypothetical protein
MFITNKYTTGVEKLVDVYRERPNFADPDAQEEARQRLNQVRIEQPFPISIEPGLPVYLCSLTRLYVVGDINPLNLKYTTQI